MSTISTWVKLGEFTIESGRVTVDDPCYYEEQTGDGLLVKKGQWIAMAAQTNEEPWGTRNALLIAHHIDDPIDLSNTQWTQLESGVCVESGQAGIFDVNYWGKEHIITEQIENPLTGESKWYDLCCARTLETDESGGVIPFGCVSSSGIGDGYYKAYSNAIYGSVVALAIDFRLLPPIYLLPELKGPDKQLFDLVKNDKISESANWLAKNNTPNLGWFFSYCVHTNKDDMLIALVKAAGSTTELDMLELIDNNKRLVFEQIKDQIDEPFNFKETIDRLRYLSPENALYWSQLLVENGLEMDDDGKFYLKNLAVSIYDEKMEFLLYWVNKGMRLEPQSLDPENIEAYFEHAPLLKNYLLENYKSLEGDKRR